MAVLEVAGARVFFFLKIGSENCRTNNLKLLFCVVVAAVAGWHTHKRVMCVCLCVLRDVQRCGII